LAYHAITGGFVLAEIVKRVTGKPIRTVLKQEILEPLGFRWTNYGVAARDVAKVALAYFTGPPLMPPLSTLLERALGVPMDRAIALTNDPRFLTAVVPAGNVIYKVKTGVKPHREDLEHLAAIRKEFGDKVDLRLDYNQALAPFGAIRILRDVEQFAPTFIEQPVSRKYLDAMASLTAALETPVLADESCFDRRDMMEVVRREAADAVSIKLMKAGGLFEAQAIMAIADVAGLPGYGGTLWEGGIGLAAGTQLIAATPGISLGCEFYMPHHVLTEDVLEERIPNRAGHVVVPDGPGLGIRVSEASVRANARVLATA